jgi:hypothetical protein
MAGAPMSDRTKVMTHRQRDSLVLQVGCWAWGSYPPPCKTWICLETSTEASEEEESWGEHGQKTGRSAVEEEDVNVVAYLLTHNTVVAKFMKFYCNVYYRFQSNEHEHLGICMTETISVCCRSR